MDIRGTLLLALSLLAPAAGGEEAPSAAALAEAMRQVRYSDGFEARMNLTRVAPDGRRSQPLKLALLGQIASARGRLLIRGLAPDEVRRRYVVAERIGDGPIKALAYRGAPAEGPAPIDPTAPLFDSELVVWDLFAPWWGWNGPRLVGTGRVAEDECVTIRCETAAPTTPIRAVVSCVDQGRRLSLRTQLFDGHGNLVRTIVVDEAMRKESGRVAARRLSITGADHAVTEIEVYSGDEEYRVPPGTFAVLEGAAGD